MESLWKIERYVARAFKTSFIMHKYEVVSFEILKEGKEGKFFIALHLHV